MSRISSTLNNPQMCERICRPTLPPLLQAQLLDNVRYRSNNQFIDPGVHELSRTAGVSNIAGRDRACCRHFQLEGTRAFQRRDKTRTPEEFVRYCVCQRFLMLTRSIISPRLPISFEGRCCRNMHLANVIPLNMTSTAPM